MLSKDLWTYLLVTVVTVLIWLWAAGETREERTMNSRVEFDAKGEDQWIFSPSQHVVTVDVQGSRLAIEKIEEILRRSVRLEVPGAAGSQTIDLAQELRRLREIRETGASIRSIVPATIDIDLDLIERVSAQVRPVLPGVQFVDDLQSDPPEVVLNIPSRLRQRIPKDLTVEALVDAAELQRLDRGVPQIVEVRARLPEWLTYAGNVTVTPPRVKLSFTIRSRMRDATLESVTVQVADIVEERDRYRIQIEPQTLHNVTITAESDLIGRIEKHEVSVIAVVHLAASEIHERIASKPVSYFIALVPDGNGVTGGTPVKGRIGDSTEPPVISLRITERLEPQ